MPDNRDGVNLRAPRVDRRTNDIPELRELAERTFRVAFGDSVSESDLEAQCARTFTDETVASWIDQDLILVAEHRESFKLVGFGQIGWCDYPEIAESQGNRALHRLYVESHFQNQGIGQRLLDALISTDVDATTWLYLDVWEKNAGAIALYRSRGFRVVGRKRFVVDSGAPTDDDLIMRRLRAPLYPIS
ncbi:MAG: GNAT family N-acetyltransferase [Pseudomonadaceae bacterium]|nr:GNAT family N-acetyltransferase [Pseudomonadaceae bacterium]